MGSRAGGGRTGSNRPTRVAAATIALTAMTVTTMTAWAAAATSVPAKPAGATTAFVRVNQIGYDAPGPKRAYLMASDRETGASFDVRDANGSVVYSAPVGPRVGGWSVAYPDVYALDFDAVRTTGTYTVTVGGPIAAASPSFRIASGAQLYGAAMANALSFYQNERDGPDYLPSPLRSAPAHLHDEHAMTYRTPRVNPDGGFRGDLHALGPRIDASGGWWDAGDYPKFVETTSYTVDLLLLGVRDFPDQLGAGSTASDFTAEAHFGTDWLLKMWDDASSTLYYQVGIGSGNDQTAGDHDIWRLPQEDDTYGGTDPFYRYIRDRPVFRAGAPGSLISPNLAGRLAAAFAECFQVFRAVDPAYARRCLLAGEHVFALANPAPRGRLLTVIPFDFYGESEWRDDMELGATELYLALSDDASGAGARFYLRQAAHWAHEYIAGPNDARDTLNLYDVSGLAHFELDRAIAQAGDPPGLEVTRADLAADMQKALEGAVAQSESDAFGFGNPWNTWDTTSHGAELTVMADAYDQLTGTDAYGAYGRRWLANILGANAWGTSLIVGDGSTFPFCMQHQVANLVGSLNGAPPILAGAVVEGPNSFAARGTLEHMVACPPDGVDVFAPFDAAAVYKDNVQSYSTVEPAIDLTASSPLAFAWQVTSP